MKDQYRSMCYQLKYHLINDLDSNREIINGTDHTARVIAGGNIDRTTDLVELMSRIEVSVAFTDKGGATDGASTR